jgi:23S rRNA (pseudouridine1915-N3)-methyltransferase
MLLHIIARGKIGRSSEAEMVERYLKRIGWPTKVTELPDRGGMIPPAPPASVTIALDERGEAVSSMMFAKKLEAWRDGGKREARFLIGAADGHDEAQRIEADWLCWRGRCWPSNYFAPHRSLRTIPITAKGRPCAA